MVDLSDYVYCLVILNCRYNHFSCIPNLPTIYAAISLPVRCSARGDGPLT